MREEIKNENLIGKSEIIAKQKQRIEKQKELLERHKEQWKMYNTIVFTICNLVGTLIALYVGGWIMFAKSILGTYMAYTGGTLTLAYFLKALIKCACAATAAGAIWCGGYMLGRKLER